MDALALMLKPIRGGWAITLTDGRELARFTGLGAKHRALHYLASHDATPQPQAPMRACGAAGQPRNSGPASQRAHDRHCQGVVAGELRRMARQFGPAQATSADAWGRERR